MTDIDLEGLSEIEELRCILSLHDQASQYLESFEWCVKTIRSWHDKKHSSVTPFLLNLIQLMLNF